MSKEDAWTTEQRERLKIIEKLGLSVEQMADELDKSVGQIRFTLFAMGLRKREDYKHPDALKKYDSASARYQVDPSRMLALQGDHAFKLRMLAAMKSGGEKVQAVVVKDRSPSNARRIYAEIYSVGSPAAMCAE